MFMLQKMGIKICTVIQVSNCPTVCGGGDIHRRFFAKENVQHIFVDMGYATQQSIKQLLATKQRRTFSSNEFKIV